MLSLAPQQHSQGTAGPATPAALPQPLPPPPLPPPASQQQPNHQQRRLGGKPAQQQHHPRQQRSEQHLQQSLRPPPLQRASRKQGERTARQIPGPQGNARLEGAPPVSPAARLANGATTGPYNEATNTPGDSRRNAPQDGAVIAELPAATLRLSAPRNARAVSRPGNEMGRGGDGSSRAGGGRGRGRDRQGRGSGGGGGDGDGRHDAAGRQQRLRQSHGKRTPPGGAESQMAQQPPQRTPPVT